MLYGANEESFGIMHEIWRFTLNRYPSKVYWMCSKCGLLSSSAELCVSVFRRLPCDEIRELRDGHHYEAIGKTESGFGGWAAGSKISCFVDSIRCKDCWYCASRISLRNRNGDVLMVSAQVGGTINSCSAMRMKRALS